MLGTRRIGPDLTRVGLKVADHWHFAHHWAPRAIVPDSIMPAFPWLYRTARVTVIERAGAATLADSPELRGLFSFANVPLPLYPSPDAIAFAARTDGTPVLDVENLPEP